MSNLSLSFSNQLFRAKEMISFLKTFEGYNPPRAEESIEGFQTFIDKLTAANQAVADYYGNGRFSTKNRRSSYFDKVDSVMRSFSDILHYVNAKYGKESSEYSILNSIMLKMRSSKLTTKVTAEADPKEKRKYGNSARSFGSMTQNFSDFITNVMKFEGFNPDLDEYKPEGLKQLLVKINSLNDDVSLKKSDLKKVQIERKDLFKELKNRTDRIKSYVRFKYGSDSTEYNQIRSLRF